MKPSEAVRIFETYHRLLAFYEPHDALLWLIRPQQALGDATPCELLASHEGYERVRGAIDQLRDGAFV